MTRRALKALVLSAFVVSPILVACGGKTVSIGNNQADLVKVDPTTFSAAITSCPTGFAHPNICCDGGKDTPSICGAYFDAPFRPCDAGWSTYPNANECCSLDDPSKCVAPTSSGGGGGGIGGGNGGGTSCNWACPPGWWPEGATQNETPPCDPSANGGDCSNVGGGTNSNSGSCCQLLSSGGTICQGWAVDIGTPDCTGPVPQPYPDFDAGPAPDAGTYDGGPPPPPLDAGFGGGEDAGVYGCDGGTYGGGGTVQSCACPDGFTSASPAGDVCCRGMSDGSTECFSVANGGPSSGGGNGSGGGSVPPSIGGGSPGEPPAMRSCSGTAGTGTGSATCSCEGATSSHKQSMDCSGTPVACVCTVDGVVTNKFVAAAADCSSADWAQCGF
ncbi:MAG: hypothetical protein ABIP89_11145 [Polyangiaceae bacterium]